MHTDIRPGAHAGSSPLASARYPSLAAKAAVIAPDVRQTQPLDVAVTYTACHHIAVNILRTCSRWSDHWP